MKYPRFWIAARGGPLSVARLPGVPEAVLRCMAGDKSYGTRVVPAERAGTPVDVLRELAVDPEPMVRAAHHGRLSISVGISYQSSQSSIMEILLGRVLHLLLLIFGKKLHNLHRRVWVTRHTIPHLPSLIFGKPP